MYGSIEAEYEASAPSRGGVDSLLMPFQDSEWTIKVHVDNKGIIDGLRKGEEECIKREQEMQTCGHKFGENT